VVLYDLSIDPVPTQHYFEYDAWQNQRECFSLLRPHTHLHVRAHSRMHMSDRAAVAAEDTAAWEAVREHVCYAAGRPYAPVAEFAFPSPYVPLHRELRAYGRRSFRRGRPIAAAAVELMHRLHEDFTYAPASTAVSTPVLQAFAQRRGVCQDYAHVMIGCLRALGLPVHYVSGYLLTRMRPGQPQLVGADASHAWVGVWCPGSDWAADGSPGVPQGMWLELDPTNDCVADRRHIRLAVGRDYGDVTPVRGVIHGGGAHTLKVHVTTTPLQTGPKVGLETP
jgi:transglutaminase-like putative cysteine protease